MISASSADIVLCISLIASLVAYFWVSKRDGSYLNVLTPAFVVSIPAYYLLPMFYTHVVGNEATPYSYIYIYATMAIESIVFATFYTRTTKVPLRSPFAYSYGNFGFLALIFLGLAVLIYAPIVWEFREFALDPREIYKQTRTGFGLNFYTSSALSYLAIILVLFSTKSRLQKGLVIVVGTLLISLHGSKGMVLNVIFLLALFFVYVARRRVGLLRSVLAGTAIGAIGLALFAATMFLGDSPLEALQSISEYSDYTRNGMMVIDSKMPIQYGRLTFEANVIGRIPRVLMPNKPKNFGYMYLDEVFYPELLDQDIGAPSFGIGTQYADFGVFAVVYLAAFAALRGWLARVFINRLELTHHPADFLLVAFFADISVFSVGGVGWLLPEAIVVAAFLFLASRFGADKVYRERFTSSPRLMPPPMRPSNSAGTI